MSLRLGTCSQQIIFMQHDLVSPDMLLAIGAETTCGIAKITGELGWCSGGGGGGGGGGGTSDLKSTQLDCCFICHVS